jgi:GT2 family glycosyltransferase
MKFAIGIPTLNRIDLLYPSVLMYSKTYPNTEIIIVDNGHQETALIERIPKVTVIKNESNIGVGASWNVLCKEIFKSHPNALILNDDIFLGKSEREVEDFLDKKRIKGAFVRPPIDWCAFILPKRVYEAVGEFDECFFPAYYEDNSYEYRMKLKGALMLKDPFLNPYVYRVSQTLEKAKSFYDASKQNKQLYIEMWGGEPSKEKFKTPFNK